MSENYFKKYEPFFGSWYIKEQIGEGAFGQVYIIEREEMGVTYKSALKTITIPQNQNEIKSVMSDGMTDDEVTEYYKGMVQNIVNEFILMSKLRGNSNIVSYEDHVIIEHEDDIGWDILIRMELLTPLVEYTSETIMKEEEVIKLGIDLCKALEFCRKYDIVHRDIKPENIFIAPSGDFKLGDFGIAKTIEKTRIGLSRKGTFIYMAPEVYFGKAYGESVDMYSLGLVMYKLLNNNRTPFMPAYPEPISYEDREDAFEKRIEGGRITAPQNGDDRLKEIVLKACQFKPEDRYHTAEEMRKDLEDLLYQKRAEAAAEKPVADKSGKKVSKKVIAAVLTAAVLAIAAIVYAVVPHAITDIAGISENETMLIGDKLTPEYQILPEKYADEELNFTAEKTSVIKVNENGVITAVGVGSSKLFISTEDYTEEVVITVRAKVEHIDAPSSIELTEGETQHLEPVLSPEKYAKEKVTYKVKNKSVAAVDDDGTVTAIAPGSTVITIIAGGCKKEVQVTVNEYIAPVPVKTYTPSYSNRTENKSDSSSSDGSGFFDSGDDEYF